MNDRPKFFAWRFEVWGGGCHYLVCEHPAGSERKVACEKVFRTEGACAVKAAEMNRDWERYRRAMLDKPGDTP
jgi:hypothetical protein